MCPTITSFRITDSDNIDPYLQAYSLYHSRYRNANYASSLPLEQVSS
jgi:hypothetical protein